MFQACIWNGPFKMCNRIGIVTQNTTVSLNESLRTTCSVWHKKTYTKTPKKINMKYEFLTGIQLRLLARVEYELYDQ